MRLELQVKTYLVFEIEVSIPSGVWMRLEPLNKNKIMPIKAVSIPSGVWMRLEQS